MKVIGLTGNIEFFAHLASDGRVAPAAAITEVVEAGLRLSAGTTSTNDP
jgi:hypothetical protein